MKVLLVNTLQKPNQSSSASSVSVGAKPIISTSIAPRSLVSIQPKPTLVQNSTIQSTYQTRSATANAQATKTQTLLSSNKYLCSASSSTSNDSGIKRTTTFKQKATTPGFRTLLNQLVQLQSRQLEVSQQRLEVERERLDFEKSTADKILTAMNSLLQSKVDAKNESD